jgi:hypothetical protein
MLREKGTYRSCNRKLEAVKRHRDSLKKKSNIRIWYISVIIGQPDFDNLRNVKLHDLGLA